MTLDKLTINHFPRLDYAASEALNTLWTNLSFSGSNMKTFAITSCRLMKETFVVMNLARTIAGTGKSVADRCRSEKISVMPGAGRVSGMSGEMWGLVHYLTDTAPLSRCSMIPIFQTEFNPCRPRGYQLISRLTRRIFLVVAAVSRELRCCFN